MVMFTGGKHTKIIPHCQHQCGDHAAVPDEEVLDADAYWNLDFDGTLLPEGADLTLLYARAAWPTLQAAQQQWRTERDALEHQRRPMPRGRRS